MIGDYLLKQIIILDLSLKERGNHIMVVYCVCITIVRVRFPISPSIVIIEDNMLI